MSYVNNNKSVQERALDVTRELKMLEKHSTKSYWQWRKNQYGKVWDFHHKQVMKELRGLAL